MAQKTKSTSSVLFVAIIILLSLGILDALFLTYLHLSPDSSRFCGAGEFNCDIVNKGAYSTLDGVSYFLVMDLGVSAPIIDLASRNWVLNLLLSNAFLGTITLVIVLFLVICFKKEKHIGELSPAGMLRLVRWLLFIGVLYGTYLFYIQKAILKTYCLYCLILDGILLGSLALVMLLNGKERT